MCVVVGAKDPLPSVREGRGDGSDVPQQEGDDI